MHGQLARVAVERGTAPHSTSKVWENEIRYFATALNNVEKKIACSVRYLGSSQGHLPTLQARRCSGQSDLFPLCLQLNDGGATSSGQRLRNNARGGVEAVWYHHTAGTEDRRRSLRGWAALPPSSAGGHATRLVANAVVTVAVTARSELVRRLPRPRGRAAGRHQARQRARLSV